MSVNQPEPKNFVTVKETTKTQTTKDHPDVVYLQDVQGVQLEVYRAGVEDRKPNFDEFSEAAVAAAGWDKKKRKPIANPLPGEPLPTVVEQAPLDAHELNDQGEGRQGTADPIADPAKKGWINSQDTDTKKSDIIDQQPEDQLAVKAAAEAPSISDETTRANSEVSAVKQQGEQKDPVSPEVPARQNVQSPAPVKKAETPPVKKAASSSSSSSTAKKTTAKKASPRAKKAAAARKSAK